MLVRVLYFGVLKDHTGLESEEVELPEGTSLATLLDNLQQRKPAKSSVWESSAVALNLHYLRDFGAFDTQYLSEGDEIAFLPPVSGGRNAR